MSDYKTEFAASVDEVVRLTKNGVLPYDQLATRAQAIDQLCQDYISERIEENEAREANGCRQVAVRPDKYELERLADAILHETLSDKRRDKMTIEEYPILTRDQYYRRVFGGHVNKQGVRRREVSLDAAAFVGTDDVNYAKIPMRGQMGIDRATTAGVNAERQRKYREFTKEQQVTTYRIAVDA